MPITTNVVSLNLVQARCIHYVITFLSDLQQVCSFLCDLQKVCSFLSDLQQVCSFLCDLQQVCSFLCDLQQVCSFLCDLQQVCSFLCVIQFAPPATLDCQDITEILLKVTLNTMKLLCLLSIHV